MDLKKVHEKTKLTCNLTQVALASFFYIFFLNFHPINHDCGFRGNVSSSP